MSARIKRNKLQQALTNKRNREAPAAVLLVSLPKGVILC